MKTNLNEPFKRTIKTVPKTKTKIIKRQFFKFTNQETPNLITEYKPKLDSIAHGTKNKNRLKTKLAEAKKIDRQATKTQETKKLETLDLNFSKNKNPTIERKIIS